MALRDPGMLEFAEFVRTEELATDFAREHGLLLSGQQLIVNRGIQNPNPSRALGTKKFKFFVCYNHAFA